MSIFGPWVLRPSDQGSLAVGSAYSCLTRCCAAVGNVQANTAQWLCQLDNSCKSSYPAEIAMCLVSRTVQTAIRFVSVFSCCFCRYKWVCSLRGSNDFHFCGCSLIAPSVVLTAAHCLDQLDTSLSLPWVEVSMLLIRRQRVYCIWHCFSQHLCTTVLP